MVLKLNNTYLYGENRSSYYEDTATDEFVLKQPPKLKEEIIGTIPGKDYTWICGNWRFVDKNWVWHSGYLGKYAI